MLSGNFENSGLLFTLLFYLFCRYVSTFQIVTW